MKRLLPLAAVLAAAGIAALAVNLLLTDYASGRDDPVGTLSPRAELPGTDTSGATGSTSTDEAPPPATTDTAPTATDDDGGDDDRGRGRGRNRGRGGDGSGDDD